jgi:hypothetical protein
MLASHLLGLELDFQGYIEGGGGRGETGQGRGIALGARWSGYAIGIERCEGHDPGRKRGGEVFGEEGAEGLILPRLHAARGPVVEQAEAEDALFGFGDGKGAAEGVVLGGVLADGQSAGSGLGGELVAKAGLVGEWIHMRPVCRCDVPTGLRRIRFPLTPR